MSKERVNRLIEDAEQAARNGRSAEATVLLNKALHIAPDDPRVLNSLGNRALAVGEPKTARLYFERALEADMSAVAIWFNLAIASERDGDVGAEIAALERALAIDPYFLLALLRKAQWLERHGPMTEVVRAYQALVDAVPVGSKSPDMARALDHGRALINSQNRKIYDSLIEALGDLGDASERFLHCLDVLVGRRTVYHQKPAGLHFPYLPQMQFFDRKQFPWFTKLEAATGEIREEFLSAVARGSGQVPYIRIETGQPLNQWKDLNNSLDWTAVFLWKDGTLSPDARARFPRTVALLESIPLLDIKSRGPTAMFSILRPNTRIPPHHGVTNTRCVVHLPLVVPEGCGFRVGSETRLWREGQAWAFDDTIEHEAWNDSGYQRIILIVDAWNPYLTDHERALLRLTDAVLQRVEPPSSLAL